MDQVLKSSGIELVKSLYNKFYKDHGKTSTEEFITACAGKGVRPSEQATAKYLSDAFENWRKREGHSELFPVRVSYATTVKEPEWLRRLRGEADYWSVIRSRNLLDEHANRERHRQHMIRLHEEKVHKQHIRIAQEQNKMRQMRNIQIRNQIYQDEVAADHVINPCPFCEKRPREKQQKKEVYTQYNFSGKCNIRQPGFVVRGKVDRQVQLKDDMIFGSCHVLQDKNMVLVTGTNGYTKHSLAVVEGESVDISGWMLVSDEGKISLRLYFKDESQVKQGLYDYMIIKRAENEIEIEFTRRTTVLVEDLGADLEADLVKTTENLSFLDSGPEALSYQAVGSERIDSFPTLEEFVAVNEADWKFLINDIHTYRCSLHKDNGLLEEIGQCCIDSHVNKCGDYFKTESWQIFQELVLKDKLRDLRQFATYGLMQAEMAKTAIIVRWLQRVDSKYWGTLTPDVVHYIQMINVGYIAVAPGDESTGLWSYLEKIMGVVKWTADTALETLKKAIQKTLNFFSGLMDLIGGSVKNAFDKFAVFVLDRFVQIIDPAGVLKKLQEGEFARFIKATIFFVILGITAIGLISYVTGFYIGKKLIAGLTGTEDNIYQAAGPTNPITSVMSVVTFVAGGLGISDTDYLVKSCRNLVALAAGGTVLLNFTSSMIYLLPTAIAEGLILRFGTQAQIVSMKVKSWTPQALGLIKVSTVPTVMTSNDYFDKVTTCLAAAGSFAKDVPVEIKTQFVGLYMQLLKISVILTQFQNSNAQRTIPFSIHIAGKPGVGKTFMAYKLLREAFNSAPTEVYSRPINTEYWSGYMNQKVILYDEFLVGGTMSDETKKTALEYLQLISPAPFQPDMASLDNPTVGIKGTYASPEIVLSLNNTLYNQPDALDVDAFQRRRNCVISAVYRSDAKTVHNEPNRIDMTAYTQLERDNMEWAAFRILPGQYNEALVRDEGVWVDYNTLKHQLVTMKLEHDEISRIISSTVHNGAVEYKPVSEIIDEALRKSYSIPEGEPDVKTSLLDLVTGYFTAVGPDYRRKDKKKRRVENEPVVTTADVKKGVEQHKDVLVDKIYNQELNEMLVDVAVEVITQNNENLSVHEALEDNKLNEAIGGIDLGNSDVDYVDCESEEELSPEVMEKIRIKIQLDREREQLEEMQRVKDRLDLERKRQQEKSQPEEYVEKKKRAKFVEQEYKGRPQRDFLADVNHYICREGSWTLVDPTVLHVHRCVCGKTVAHKHERLEKHNFFLECEHEVREAPKTVLKLEPGETWREYYRRIARECDLVSDRLKGDIMGSVNAYFGLPNEYFSDFSSFKTWAAHIGISFVNGFTTAVYFSVLTLLAVKGIKYLAGFNKEEEPLTFTASSSQSKRETKKAQRSKMSRGLSRPVAVGADIEVVDLIVNGMKPYHCVPVAGRWIMTYAHALTPDFIKDGDEIEVRYKGTSYKEKVVEDLFQIDWANDVCFYQLQNKQIPQFPDLTNKFMNSTDLSNLGSCCIRLPFEKKTVYSRGAVRTPGIEYGSDIGFIRQDKIFVSDFSTVRGDCGTVAVATSGPTTGKIVGYVVASNMSEQSPSTLISIITKELVLSVIKQEIPEIQVGPGDFQATGLDLEELGPNVIKIQKISKAEKIYIPDKTKLEPSLFAHRVNFDAIKQPAILTPLDPRANGVDPIDVGIKAFSKTTQANVDLELVTSVFQDMKENYTQCLSEFDMEGELTIEEAIGGIPGKLSSLKVDTSPGYPRMLSQKEAGKRDCFYFNNFGVLVIKEQFRKDVYNMKKSLKEGKEVDHRWIGFLKDELVSKRKIDTAKTRVIYCGDVTLVVVLRMLYGKVLLGFNNISEKSPMSIGLNQYSHDMQVMYNYLVEKGFTKFVAGDYEAFDQRMQKVFQDEAYNLILGMASTTNETDLLTKKTQMGSPFQIGNYRFEVESGNASGCLFTSVLNSLVNEAYFRYCFEKLNPEQSYDSHVRAKFLGDDHLLAVSEECRFGGKDIAGVMPELNQVYTSDDKESVEIPQHRKFEECTFLGAHPKRVEGSWVGALKKETIMQTILWTRNRNGTIVEEAKSMIEYAALWDEEFYLTIRTEVNRVLKELGIELILPSKRQLMKEVAYRTAASGKDYSRYLGASDFKYTAVGIESAPGLTIIATDTEQAAVRVQGKSNLSAGFSQRPMDLMFSSETLVNRGILTWAETAVQGDILASYDVPFGLLDLGDKDNLQNMPFDRYAFWRGDVELVLQSNGTPFQQGLLCAFFYPLATKDMKPTIEQWTQCQHVFLSPSENTTATLKIPFNWIRQALAVQLREDSLGTIHIGVFSPLLDSNSQTNTVTIYSRFPNSDFVLPLPTGTSTYQAVGAGSSRVQNTYTYNVRDIAGSMPIQQRQEGNSQTFTTDVKATMPLPGLDNPMIAGSSIPVVNKFSALSKGEGLEPTTNLTLVQDEVSVEHFLYRDPAETQINEIMDKPAFVGQATWNDTDDPDKQLYFAHLDSAITTVGYQLGDLKEISASLGVLNTFMFWHADIEFEFRVVKTGFHSGRLRFVVAYGLKEFTGSDNKYFNAVIDFDAANSVHRVLVPYNSPLEWTETWSGGSDPTNPPASTSLGCAKLVVQTKLRHPANVASTVKVLVFARFKNVRVSVPRPMPFLNLTVTNLTTEPERTPFTISLDTVTDESKKYIAVGIETGGSVGVVPVEQSQVDQNITTDAVAVTDITQGANTSRFMLGKKFEHEVKDIHEVARRKIPVPVPSRLTKDMIAELGARGMLLLETRQWDSQQVDVGDKLAEYTYLNGPYTIYSYFYAMWAGSIAYRVHSTDSSNIQFSFMPGITTERSYNIGMSTIADTDTTEIIDTKVKMTYTGRAGTQGAREVLFPVGLNNWIDVNVPFQIPLDRLTLGSTYAGHAGTVTFGVAQGTEKRDSYLQVYQGVGDDFRFSVWRPPLHVKLGIPIKNNLTATVTMSSLYRMYGFYIPKQMTKKPTT